MDKSESEILEEWDLVSSVYDTEQENITAEKTTETNSEAETNGITETSCSVVTEIDSNADIINKTADDEGKTDSENSSSVKTKRAVSMEKNIDADIIKTAEIDNTKAVETDTKETDGADNGKETVIHFDEGDKGDVEELVEAVTKQAVEAVAEETVEAVAEETVEAIAEETVEADTEETSEPDTEEITVIETIMYDVKKIADVDSEKAIAANIEKVTYADIQEASSDINQKTDNIDVKSGKGNEVEECSKADINNSTETNYECRTGASMNHSSVDNSGDQVINNGLDSSMEHIQMGYSKGSCLEDLPDQVPVLSEQENAALESSSSDIDIIDENIEESVTSSFLHPLSLSISSSVDTSSVLTSLSEDDKNGKIEDLKQPERSESPNIKSETYPKTFEADAETFESVSKKCHFVHQKPPDEIRENIHRQSHPHSGIFTTILQFLRNMKCLEWSLLGGIVLGLYLTVVINYTNIFAVVEKDDIINQMKKMIDELKYDNNAFSSFEHQIKELRKESSRLNHMMYDVAKVLEKQKNDHDSFQKKESESLAPFKKEINKLKEHINILKFDNEELQKQLVRMRYASYAQGGKDINDNKEGKQKEETIPDENISSDEIPLDINSLKKWNELISLLSKELSLSLEHDPQVKEKLSENRRHIGWYWNVILQNFKGTFEELKANISSKFSDYKKVHESTISDIYKFVKKMFTVEEQNNQKFAPSNEESSQWKNIGDFFNDLKDKWIKIKNRIDTSDLKSVFKDFKFTEKDKTTQYDSQKPEIHEHNERKPTNAHFQSKVDPTNVHFGSDNKHGKVQSNSENAEWMFERSSLRAELRESQKEDEDSVNWFLKKNKHLSKDDKKENKY